MHAWKHAKHAREDLRCMRGDMHGCMRAETCDACAESGDLRAGSVYICIAHKAALLHESIALAHDTSASKVACGCCLLLSL